MILRKGGIAAADMYINSQTGRAHLLLVSRTPGKAGGALGVVTLEGTCAWLVSFQGVD